MNVLRSDDINLTSIAPTQISPFNGYSSLSPVQSIAIAAMSRHAGSPKARKVHKTHAPKSGKTRSTLHHHQVDGMIDGLEYQSF